MSELMSNSPSEFEPKTAEAMNGAADTSAADSAKSRIVVRYDTDAGSSEPRNNPEGEEELAKIEGNSVANRDLSSSRPRMQSLVGVLIRSLVAIVLAGIQGVIRYPRTSAAAGLSVLILGAISYTHPDKPIVKAEKKRKELVEITK